MVAVVIKAFFAPALALGEYLMISLRGLLRASYITI